MTSRTPTPYKLKRGLLYAAEFGEIEISKNDTVTFSNFDSSKALLNVAFWDKTNGTAIACTKALNVATITGEGTNVDCVYMAYGYKA